QISGILQPWNYYVTDKQAVEQDPYTNQTVYFYDDHGRTIAIQKADGAGITTTYDGQNHPILAVDALGTTNLNVYDGNQNLVRAVQAAGATEQRVTVNV